MTAPSDVDVALSIVSAAREVPDRPALITAERTMTFAELADAAAVVVPSPAEPGHATPLFADPSLDTVIAIVAALQRRRPIAPLHPRSGNAAMVAARAALARHPVPDDTAAVLFTSGSTAAPRGVVLSRRAMIAAAAASAGNLPWRDDDRWLLCLPLGHAGGFGVVVRCLIARRPIVLHAAPFDAAAVAALATAALATLASLVPTQLDAMIAHRLPLRAILLGGAAAPPALLARAHAAGTRFLCTYGMTEAFGQVATARLVDAGRADAPLVPLAGITLRAGTAAAPAPITIDGGNLMTGYLGEPARTGPLRTSDLGWLDDGGALHVTGRADDVIITGGENVHPVAVEAAVASAPGIAAACAVGLPDPRWGQIVACAVVPLGALDLAGLDAWLVAHLPAQLRPRRLAVLETLPLLPTGKLDRRAVAALFARR